MGDFTTFPEEDDEFDELEGAGGRGDAQMSLGSAATAIRIEPATARKATVIAKTAMKIFQSSQKDLKKYLQRFLVSQKYSPVSADGFLYAAGEVPVLLIAHLDTVHLSLPSVICKGGESGNVWMSPYGIGGDDRSGVYMLCEIIKKVKCHVLFCEDEEIGGVGARKFTQSDIRPNVNHIVEFDRMGTNDAVFYSCDNKEYVTFIESFGFVEAYGSYSDISTIAPYLGIAAVNISSGYYNPHMKYEYVDFRVMHNNMERSIEMILSSDTAFKYVRKAYSTTAASSYFGAYDDDDIPVSSYYPPNKTYVRDTSYSDNYNKYANKRNRAKERRRQLYGKASTAEDGYTGGTGAWADVSANNSKLLRKVEQLSLLPHGMCYSTDDLVTSGEYSRKRVSDGLGMEESESLLEETDDAINTFFDRHGLLPGYGSYDAEDQDASIYEETLCMLKEGEYVVTKDGTMFDDSEYLFMIDPDCNVYLMAEDACLGADGVLIDATAYSANGCRAPVFDAGDASTFLVSDLYSMYVIPKKPTWPSAATLPRVSAIEEKAIIEQYIEQQTTFKEESEEMLLTSQERYEREYGVM